MKNEEIAILKDLIFQKRNKNQQLLNLQLKEVEQSEKEQKLSELLEKAKLDYGASRLLNLTGGVSDGELSKLKNHLDELSVQIAETRENLRFIAQAKSEINSELGLNYLNTVLYRGIMCKELAEQFFEKMVSDKKLYQKLIDGYSAYRKNGSPDSSWTGFLLSCFPCPDDQMMLISETKLKNDHELLRD